MWLAYAFLSATLLGFYDVFKKQSLKNNAVIPVLFLNTLFCSLIFLPFIVLSACGSPMVEDSMFHVPMVGWESHKYIILKSCKDKSINEVWFDIMTAGSFLFLIVLLLFL